MVKKVPVTVMVDPDVGGEFTIKPFAATLAAHASNPQGSIKPESITGTATGTNLTGAADVDADADYSSD